MYGAARSIDTEEAHLVHEYRVLNFFWEKFGLDAKRLSEKSARWVMCMLTIGAAESKALEDQVKTATSTPPPQTRGGKQVVKRTLMEF